MTISRRTFLKSSAAIAPVIVSASALGRTKKAPAGDRITVAMIGCGKMANDYHIPELLRQPDVQLVAIGEVDAARREHAKNRVEAAYSSQKLDFKGCDTYVDYREILARPDIDAVCIATPDHWHAIPIIEACKAGKDVYCEKPLTLTIEEARRCIEAARKYDRIVQTGSQQRSNVFGQFREAVEIIRSGRLGKIHRVTVGVGGPSAPCDLPEEEMEPNLDWDMWLGQAPLRPYNSVLSPRGVHNHFPNWRSYIEYSGGGHTDMGAHHYDIAQWALGMDESGPVEIIPPDDPQATSGVRYIYENGVEMVHGGLSGCTFHGENGTLSIDRGKLESDPEEIVKTPLADDEVHLPHSPGHHRNWLDCIKSREAPVAEVEKGARTVTIIHLGNLAYWHHKTLKWDPHAWKFADEADSQFIDRERRDPWQLPDV
ncbi:MAG: Gfo/Idh/MocA family oxidoreductase [Planctomycetaceae bacterium]|nr:Gfo/Idh/MocA family oxidoreductase [Planctomycetaceae bacterium]